MRAQSVTAALIYTADGLRAAQSVGGDVTTFAWDWASLVPELLAQSTNPQSTTYLIGHETLGWSDGTTWRTILPDALGSVRQTVDGAGAVVQTREWTPYGEEAGGALPGPGYTGEWQDAAVGLVYLRARWYAPGVGRFTQPDPWEGNRWQPISLQPYIYASDNPINWVDPTGQYDKDVVHKDLTQRVARELLSQFRVPFLPFTLAEVIANADRRVDTDVVLAWPGGCPKCHFCPLELVESNVDEVIRSRNPYLLGATLHQAQDFFSHWREGYTWEHLWDTLNAHRSQETIDDFYKGGHWDVICGEDRCSPFWEPSPSPYGAHLREQVEADILERNPGINNLSSVSDDLLIDLFLRKDPGISSSYSTETQRVEERQWFGLKTDMYIPGSARDTLMEQRTREIIRTFLYSVIENACAIDWAKPSVFEIQKFLTH